MKRIKIVDIKEGSIAQELKIPKNSYLISVNDEEIYDILDYKYQMSDEYIALEIDENNLIVEYEIEKECNEDVGLVFEQELIDNPRRCMNKCIFCFMDQLPHNMRKTLVFKDDDYRLSFLTGNYVTFTNCTNEDIDRIIKYRLSPINISVHTTNIELRKKMLNNKNAGNILEYIKKLYDNQIYMNAQIVLCPEYNDKEELLNTVNDLIAFFPYMKSISIVPVGLTDYREGLAQLRPFTIEEMKQTITDIEQLQKTYTQKYGSNIVYLSDEFYLKTNVKLPDCSYYDEFPQLENGVGMVSLFLQQFQNTVDNMDSNIKPNNIKVSTITGVLVAPIIQKCADILKEKYDVDILVYPIENNFFGKNITVTGLLTGKDIYEQLKDKELGQKLYICENMLKDDEDVFLDNMTVKQLQDMLKTEIVIVYNNGETFVNELLGLEFLRRK